MNPAQLSSFLQFAITGKEPVLVKGKPGIGKTDIIKAACKAVGAHLIISHPVVSDPTDYKGLPFASKNGKEAHFLPFGELNSLINATELTVFFLDDLGQATPAVQAAVMQLLLERRINGFKISDHVTFVAATNRKEDKAAVSGILEPVKSRFTSILELEISVNDWCKWALDNDQPIELIAFNRFRPELMDNFVPTKDIVNSPSPRTIAAIGRLQKKGLPDDLRFEGFKGAAGEGYAAEYIGFLEIYKNLPNIDKIFLAPDTVAVPTDPATLYATMAALASRTNETNATNSFAFIERMPAEIGVACVKDMIGRNEKLMTTKAFTKWATQAGNLILN